jgi:hypothetical protein
VRDHRGVQLRVLHRPGLHAAVPRSVGHPAGPNLTDLALGLGGSDRRIATGAFNIVRWGAAAPAPIIAGKLAETSLALPYWVGFGVLAAGAIVYVLFAHVLAAGYGERVLWARWNRAARAGERAAQRPVGEVV